jgi:allene oxide cyclase-like protein
MRALPAAVTAATAAAAITASAIAATAGGQGPQGRTITLTEVPKGATFGFVDNLPRTTFSHEGEPRKLSVGDIEIESIAVADQKGNRVGRFDAYCIVSRPGRPSHHGEECTGTYRLKDGTISAVGSFVGSETSPGTFPIVGGSRAYGGARGTLTISAPHKDGTRTDTLALLP